MIAPTTEPRVVVSWAGASEPIMLTLYGPDGEVAVPMVPKRVHELAQRLIQPAVRSIKANQWGEDWPG